jgi:adenylate cyclase
MADGLIAMRELGAAYAISDIEYVDKSPSGLNSNVLKNEIPKLVTDELASLEQHASGLIDSFGKGDIPLRDAGEFVAELDDHNDKSRNAILEGIKDIERNNDEYLGRASHFFGKAFYTINMRQEKETAIPAELKSYIEEKIALKNIVDRGAHTRNAADIRPAIFPIISRSAGAGFPNVVIDADGLIRRIDLLESYNGKFYLQLAMAPLLDLLGNPEMTIESNRIILKGAKLPQKDKPVDISIPLIDDGTFLLNWLKKSYETSFRHLSFYSLVSYKENEAELISYLYSMKEGNYFAFTPNALGNQPLLDAYERADLLKKRILAGGDTVNIRDYIKLREYFYGEVKTLLSGETEKKIVGTIDQKLALKKITPDLKKEYESRKEQVKKLFKNANIIYKLLEESRNTLAAALRHSICFIGWTGTSTTDLGATAFSGKYMNLGVHATIVNSILNRSFLDMLPWWISGLIAIAVSLIVVLVIRRLEPLSAILTGLGFVVSVIVLLGAVFVFTGVYVSILTPVLSVFVSFIIQTFSQFMKTEKEKSFIRNAFSCYLSAEVISELVNDPSKLTLGGLEKQLTAMFTDIRGFSTIAEILSPEDLVNLLNNYLTEMSNIILSLKGTIDKYEGDAIIAFFGAPVPFDDHAHRACYSAIRMKRMEKILNERIIANKLSPSPLFTRIGINTGGMVVGNMGTPQKMNYTIMGNSVNLAARLEGVNKLYGTSIIISENTYEEAKNGIFARRLDRMTVVGISKPVRLYEVLEENSLATPEIREGVGFFHEALDEFEKRDWASASLKFEGVKKVLPGDGPSDFFIKRCKEFLKKPPADSWDGVFNLTTK